jgi:hypothetical protein
LAGLRALRDKTLDVDLPVVAAAVGAAATGQVTDGVQLIVIFATYGAIALYTTARSVRPPSPVNRCRWTRWPPRGVRGDIRRLISVGSQRCFQPTRPTRADQRPVAPALPLCHRGRRRRSISALLPLPNGYCGLPVQQNCPHANACLTCRIFLTTLVFLPEHRAQRQQSLQLVTPLRPAASNGSPR